MKCSTWSRPTCLHSAGTMLRERYREKNLGRNSLEKKDLSQREQMAD